MDRPIVYHGGPETFFQRAESAAFFGREIGLMYTHSHLRYGEAMSDIGEFAALWEALLVANPIAVTDQLAHASLRQRNAYFSSSDAAFQDRYQASAEWARVKAERDRRRRRMADLFERPRPLHQHAHSPCLRAATPIRQANRDARSQKVAQRTSPSHGPAGPAAARRGDDEGDTALRAIERSSP